MKKKIVLAFLIMAFGIAGAAFAMKDQSVQVRMKYGSECTIVRTCDDMVYVDCGAAVDGPAYYLDENLEVIGTSGGLCMEGCTGAPKEWTICDGRQTDIEDLDSLR
tara:strand:+ start:59919 stop:60236 length:318 start_codon:yes stop_codon:yes gene_type:complete